MSKRSPNTPIAGLQKKLKTSQLGTNNGAVESDVATRLRRQLLVVQIELDRVKTLNKFLEWERTMQVHH
ncbi:HDL526Wp [Eremothecium sinecaudum]|uniref:HDL526Wp n=1 Tax=Eremothecium sinecaudum TaxID=45286 RepID=A0A109UYW6_9SACH|nr:HDL526Wp [Eremothecium sinecaudum]AMD20218.1 HDL526Wp [Eremothecium sinecaudum]